MASPTIHASAVLVGARAVLIQGPSGSGKSRLALALVQAAPAGAVPFARLVGDDRVHIEAVHGRLLIRPAAALAGRIEVRGLGIRNLPYEPVAVAGVVVELGPPDSERVPRPDQREIELSGVRLPRLAVAAGDDPVPILLAHLQTQPDTASGNPGRHP
jgi:serine kinase of HPr protein (carbohydrate metabolism regulator)